MKAQVAGCGPRSGAGSGLEVVLGLAVLEKMAAGWSKEGIASKWGWKTNTGTLSRKEFVKHLLKMKNTGEFKVEGNNAEVMALIERTFSKMVELVSAADNEMDGGAKGEEANGEADGRQAEGGKAEELPQAGPDPNSAFAELDVTKAFEVMESLARVHEKKTQHLVAKEVELMEVAKKWQVRYFEGTARTEKAYELAKVHRPQPTRRLSALISTKPAAAATREKRRQEEKASSPTSGVKEPAAGAKDPPTGAKDPGAAAKGSSAAAQAAGAKEPAAGAKEPAAGAKETAAGAKGPVGGARGTPQR